MPLFLIDSLDDPRLDPYRDLKNLQRRSGASESFICEGEKLVVRLLEGPCRAESVLCTAAARDRLAPRFAAELPVYVTSTAIISRLIGFQFHRGVLACGRRPAPPSLDALCRIHPPPTPALIVLCPELRDPTNLGTIIRTTAAFGGMGLIAGRNGTDPFSRRVLRTSMGSVLRLPVIQTDDWAGVLATLHAAGFESIAAVLDPSAELLDDAPRGPRTALLFGNESAGLSADLVGLCRRQVTMPMGGGVDSINVAVAAGIIIHHFAGRRRQTNRLN
jgi:tRNA G18 (ribose-2'-O)-methylase SpoU